MVKQQPVKKSKNKSVIAVLMVVVAVLIVMGLKAVSSQRPAATKMEVLNARALGNPGAALQIVEYMDFQCPACAKGAQLLSDLVKTHPNDLYLEAKYFPLDRMHVHSIRAARYAECAARQNKYWAFSDQVFKNQNQWTLLMNSDPYFSKTASEIGLEPKALEACLSDETVLDKINAEKAGGQKLGVESTPTYFVNGKLLVGSANLEKELMDYFGRVTQ